MSDERLASILDAAYKSFARHGVRRTTMEDIAAAAGMSRPAVYQYVRNKEDAFRRLAERLYGNALVASRAAARAPAATLPDRLYGILAPKVALTQQVFNDSPHAIELLGTNVQLSADLNTAFLTSLKRLITDALADAGTARAEAREGAEIMVALTRGIEVDISDDRLPARRLRRGLTLLVAGLTNPPTEQETP